MSEVDWSAGSFDRRGLIREGSAVGTADGAGAAGKLRSWRGRSSRMMRSVSNASRPVLACRRLATSAVSCARVVGDEIADVVGATGLVVGDSLSRLAVVVMVARRGIGVGARVMSRPSLRTLRRLSECHLMRRAAFLYAVSVGRGGRLWKRKKIEMWLRFCGWGRRTDQKGERA